MSKRPYLVLVILTLVILACASPLTLNPTATNAPISTELVSTQEIPVLTQEVIPSATPLIATSYPTTGAESISPNQVVSGIEVRVERAWLDGKRLYADVCFTLPDLTDWTIWKANLKYDDVVVEEYGTTFLSLEESEETGKPGSRCDKLEFYVPPDSELTTVVVNIGSIASYPRAGEYCTIYMPKIQQAFIDRDVAITLECNDVNGVEIMQIVSKPESMSQEEAEQLVYSDEFFTIKGPWEFSFDLSP